MNEHDRVWIIGGDPECDLVVEAPAVSGRHCRLQGVEGGYLVEDLGSTNGTFVNGRPIAGPTRVTLADRVTLGRATPMPWPSAGIDASRAVLFVGRDQDNDVVLDAPMVSNRHARIVLSAGAASIEDLGSANGTFLNSKSNRISQTMLNASDVVFFGSLEVPATRLLARGREGISRPIANTNEANDALVFEGRDMVIGRDPGCDRVIDLPMISSRHARVWRSGEAIFIEDLGSANGTFVEGQRLSRRPVPVQGGDILGFGSHTLRLRDAGRTRAGQRGGQIIVEARGVGVEIDGQPLLDDVSMTIRPGELVGLMGPAGAGKSTLLLALNGYRPPTHGSVSFNGVDLYQNPATARGQVGYVPQEDIIHRGLTVGQALRFAARLRLPTDADASEIERRVADVLDQLALAEIEHSRIGSPTRGISGGQRRRVNLALELLADPPVLFLDEPTSGLSSEDALAVMRLLRRLADSGKTILLTIHQPSLEAFRTLDHLAVIGKDANGPGRLAYFGPAYPGAIAFFQPDAKPNVDPKPDEVLQGLAREPTDVWVRRYQDSSTYREYVEGRSSTGLESSESPAPNPSGGRSPLTQWWTLVRRDLAIKARDRWNTAILLAQAPLIAALIVLVFGRGAAAEPNAGTWPEVARMAGSTIFVLALAAIWFGCSNSIREIVAEWSIYRRERMVGLRLGPYLASKFTVLGGICVFQCLAMLAIVFLGSGLHGPPGPMFLILTLAALVGVALGLIASAMARTSEVAVALLPLLVLPLLLLGGALQARHELPVPIRQATALMPSRWAFEGLLVLEADRQPTWHPPLPPSLPKRFRALVESDNRPELALRDMAESYFPAASERMGPQAALLALGAMLATLTGLVAAVLRLRDRQ